MHTNRLAQQTSPYLLQHAHNPVEWYPWGDEAFAAARERGVPIFLSIGYSTCYWCHVMERESFEHEATAALMNELFVNVKVDREERPDVDDLYMAATQMMTGSGGWPMSVFLEPEGLRPYWCGTYFPREPMHGRPSFSQVLRGMSAAYGDQRADVLKQAGELAEAVRGHISERGAPVALGPAQVESATGALLQMFDRTEGGFGGAPKFPQPAYGAFLLDVLDSTGDGDTRAAIEHCVRFTLDRMAVGGLFDHAGGGFHRYCVDRVWTVPHFEKMLYYNAQLVSLYARAAERFGDPLCREIVRRTLEYVLAEMTTAEGGFCSAQDAEVRGREGLNYVWTAEQARAVLTDEQFVFADEVYGVGTPNFQDPHHPDEEQTRVLRLDDRPERVAEKLGVAAGAFSDRLAELNGVLYAARLEREQPGLDDKVLTAWNGMMIAAMVDGWRLLGDQRYLDAAERAVGFILERMRRDDGRLLRASRAGVARDDGGNGAVLEDYAHFASGLLALHGASPEGGRWLEAAKGLLDVAHADLEEDGAYFDTQLRGDLFVRARTTYDGAVPSGSSVLLHVLLDLAELEPGGPWLDRAMGLLGSLSSVVAGQAVASVNSTRGLLRVLGMGGEARARLAFGPEPESAERASPRQSPVEVFADADEVVVREGEPAELTLGLRIRDGYHVLSADPVVEGSEPGGELGFAPVPLRVGLVSGQGVAVYADYPDGEAYGAALTGTDALRVHTGELRLRVAVERADGIGPTAGEPVLGMTFQACSDEACLEPVTLKLGVKVVVE